MTPRSDTKSCSQIDELMSFSLIPYHSNWIGFANFLISYRLLRRRRIFLSHRGENIEIEDGLVADHLAPMHDVRRDLQ
jgi:hypothetical protein